MSDWKPRHKTCTRCGSSFHGEGSSLCWVCRRGGDPYSLGGVAAKPVVCDLDDAQSFERALAALGVELPQGEGR